jgi:glycosyltransferase involved in cell wall biosynthesis
MVFSPGSLPIAYLDCHQPIAFWTDATFAAMIGFYPEYSRLADACVAHGNMADQSALSRSSVAFYSSEWAADSAVRMYSVDPAKVRVVPFGANVEWGFTINQVEDFISSRPSGSCNMLFIGVDWARKGGDLAVSIAQRIEESGIPVRLDVVGCQPACALPRFARVHGYISKRDPDGRDALLGLLRQSHFLLLPSRAEAYGVAAAEASSVGVPTIATAVGGLPTVVRDGVTGYCLPKESTPEQYATLILSILDSSAYHDLAVSSFHDYEARLNWTSAGSRVASLLRGVWDQGYGRRVVGGSS